MVATLALAIGANAAIFSVVKPVLLDPGPFPHADRLVHIGGAAAGTARTVIGVMPPEFRFPDERVAFWVPMTIRAAKVTPGGRAGA